MDVDSTIIYSSNWKAGVFWGNLAGCLAFYHSLTGFSLLVINTAFILISSDYEFIFGCSILLGLIIILLGIILLPLVFSCFLGRQYHIYATIHAYVTFMVNLIHLVLIVFVSYEISKLTSFSSLSSRFLLADLGLLILTLIIGIVTWVAYVGRQFHEPNGQFILQL
ncbi:unnamed protein product [Rotaria socialis]|uniref:Uncharacterized protein n=1 Tax=Rotaria socialis TaxID=392032 RepID=A0A821S2S9_9BILA|nr:unnamed protein product [Rotaria socialis]CAF3328210.1 unnamed protein product [Rotaria socialis]CAF3407489.1 unnamed protein product [Rotaria socialis]CAF3537498.1 unnamed protein product [Rotaria socialis]CAF3668353.1 unnamed protein product [Rotaria socialis]